MTSAPENRTANMQENRDPRLARSSPAGPLGASKAIGHVLAACAVVLAIWQVVAAWSRRPFQPFELTSADFAGFAPGNFGAWGEKAAWKVRSLPVPNSHTEPNILAFELVPEGAGCGPILVRLVHGYNMPDCMRLKRYRVELVSDIPTEAAGSPAGIACRQQVWRLVSHAGEVTMWATRVIRASDFTGTDMDVAKLPFPRMGAPDDPAWEPAGITLRGLRHPVRNLKLFLRRKWNNSRSDLLTFLGLRQPAWASDRVLTLVAAGSAIGSGQEACASALVCEALRLFHGELLEWRQTAQARGRVGSGD